MLKERALMVSRLLISFVALQLLEESLGMKIFTMHPAPTEHPWPQPFGKEQHGTTNERIPSLSTMKPAWNWTFPTGRYSTVLAGGPVVDRSGNFYVVSQDALHKIGPDGHKVWSQPAQPINNMVHLFGDKLLG